MVRKYTWFRQGFDSLHISKLYWGVVQLANTPDSDSGDSGSKPGTPTNCRVRISALYQLAMLGRAVRLCYAARFTLNFLRRGSTVVVARDSYPLGRWFKSTRRYKENRMFASAYVRFESDQLTWVQVPSIL